ncbi:MAG: hypothetical protein WA798_20255 [Candidatus Acidiferrum sp.]
MKKTFAVRHDLSKLSADEVKDYLRDVSEFIGLDPELHGLDTIWMQNESGPGQSLVVYARRGTAEILRNKLGIEVSSLTNQMVKDSIVFTATGKAGGRQEVATGSKFIGGLQGKALDDAIMTASTRALRRLTMQFTSLGILDESEVKAVVGDTANPAANAQPIGDPIVIPPFPTVTNNAPGRDITPVPAPEPDIAKVYAEGAAALAAMPIPGGEAAAGPDPVRPKRARKSKNTVSMDVEPETVNGAVTPPPQPTPIIAPAAVLTPSVAVTAPPAAQVAPQPAPLPSAAPVAAPADPNEFPGKPSAEQMAGYRKRVSVYTSELPASESMGSVQKMRAFITKQSGNPPQDMTSSQWEEMLSFFESFVAKNTIKGLVKYINDSLGVK